MQSENPKLAKVRALDLHAYLGMEALQAQDGQSEFHITVGGSNTNPAGVLHGGVIYTLCDVAAYAALLSCLDPEQEAATHDIHVSVMRPGMAGERVRFAGHVVHRSKRLAFVEAVAQVEDSVIATARVTKTVFAGR